MPIADFIGQTFVAFTDISGFKELMRDDRKGLEAIKHFYQSGYDILQSAENVEGFFVSDCGILFSRNGSIEFKLESLLNAIERINKRMINSNYMLTTSIAFGNFNYQGKIEFDGIEKNPIYGGAYVQAFLDNETGKPSIQPGQCRICKQNLPQIDLNSFDKLHDRGGNSNHLTFYWNLDDMEELDRFEKKYRDSYSLKYTGMIQALKGE